MRFEAPHPIPYQGSKRLLAPTILSFVPARKYRRLIEPFSGSAAITLAAATRKMFECYVIADLLSPLTEIWRLIINNPTGLARDYRNLWRSQFTSDVTERFNQIRTLFNEDQDPAKLLFLLARCVKNAVRFSGAGKFNQSPDRRRQGMHPDKMDLEISMAHRVLSGKTEVICGDFREVLRLATPADLIYMDPPYQGISEGRDRRYIKGVRRTEMITALEELNRRGVEYILSYDGRCGRRSYGEPLPSSLGAHRVLLKVGRSSQATLNGQNHVTVESVYLSPGLQNMAVPLEMPIKVFGSQPVLFS